MTNTRPMTALFLWKKRVVTSFQKDWEEKFVSMAISPALSFRTKSLSTGT